MIWLDFLIALSCGGAGLTCGWVMHALNGVAGPQKNPPGHRGARANHPRQTDTGGEAGPDPRERLSEVADRLRAYASSMAADVDAHQTKVQQVNNTLNDGVDASPEAVLKAIQQLIEANEGMQVQLHDAQDRINEQALQLESAERRAETDALTRIPNRAALDRHLTDRHGLGAKEPTTLAMLDVDHFKKFNDVYGHRAGDEVLRVVAGMLHARLQKYGLVARYGGEEFSVVLDGYDVDQAAELVEAARIAIGQREILFEDKRLRVTASVGVARLEPTAKEESESLAHWIQRADDGLYRSKEAGRDCGHWMEGDTAHRITQASLGISQESSEAADLLDSPDEIVRVQPTSGPFLELANRAGLASEFEEIRSRTQSSVSMHLMAIRCHCSLSSTKARSLLQVVRATLRSVDRLGYEDDGTLLVFMPSVDHETVQTRAQQICRSVSAIGLDGSDGREAGSGPLVSIGIVPATETSHFDALADQAVQASDQARHELGAPILLDDEQALL